MAGLHKERGQEGPTKQYNHTITQIRYNIETYFFYLVFAKQTNTYKNKKIHYKCNTLQHKAIRPSPTPPSLCRHSSTVTALLSPFVKTTSPLFQSKPVSLSLYLYLPPRVCLLFKASPGLSFFFMTLLLRKQQFPRKCVSTFLLLCRFL